MTLYVAKLPGDPVTPEVDEDMGGPEYQDETFPDWTPETTRVISGPLGTSKFPGTRHSSWETAQAYAHNKYQVVRFWTSPGRWYARIKHVGPAVL
jgi:hypothetical protein